MTPLRVNCWVKSVACTVSSLWLSGSSLWLAQCQLHPPDSHGYSRLTVAVDLQPLSSIGSHMDASCQLSACLVEDRMVRW